jgi:hypothetical protein
MNSPKANLAIKPSPESGETLKRGRKTHVRFWHEADIMVIENVCF